MLHAFQSQQGDNTRQGNSDFNFNTFMASYAPKGLHLFDEIDYSNMIAQLIRLINEYQLDIRQVFAEIVQKLIDTSQENLNWSTANADQNNVLFICDIKVETHNGNMVGSIECIKLPAACHSQKLEQISDDPNIKYTALFLIQPDGIESINYSGLWNLESPEEPSNSGSSSAPKKKKHCTIC